MGISSKADICRGKAQCVVPRRLFQKNWLKSLDFYSVRVGSSFSLYFIVFYFRCADSKYSYEFFFVG